jgi:hypothetical protein
MELSFVRKVDRDCREGIKKGDWLVERAIPFTSRWAKNKTSAQVNGQRGITASPFAIPAAPWGLSRFQTDLLLL